jgi:pyruvate/2-oxoglutarate dehydrogenase complex dihydrolipoamide acyltransferase (E2) component
LTEDHERFELKPFPTARRLMVDGGRLGRQRHTIHGLFEIDVTQPRRTMRAQKVRTGKSPSFTAFVMACLGHAVDLNRHMHAYRDWRGRLVIFDEVDVNTLFEVEVDGRRMIRPHIIRAVNKKSFPELNTEVRTFQSAHQESSEARFVDWFTRLPATLRRLSLGLAFKNPQLMKRMMGTVSMTGLGMFGSGGFWGIPVPNHTLQVTLGGIAEKPGVVEGRIEIREYLSVTISIDHDIIDGAPATRFAQRFKELVESGYGLE